MVLGGLGQGTAQAKLDPSERAPSFTRHPRPPFRSRLTAAFAGPHPHTATHKGLPGGHNAPEGSAKSASRANQMQPAPDIQCQRDPKSPRPAKEQLQNGGLHVATGHMVQWYHIRFACGRPWVQIPVCRFLQNAGCGQCSPHVPVAAERMHRCSQHILL